MKKHRPYTLEEYNPEWKERFRNIAEVLKPIFGDNLVEVEHIGSTSIEGMLAKPQIDVLVVVKDLDTVKNLYGKFSDAGFTIHGRGYVADDDEYISFDDSNGARLTSIHTLGEGNPKIGEYKTFRNYLNQNQEDRELYMATKKELYLSHNENYTEYDSGKRDVILAIKARAKEWSKKHPS